MRIIPIVEGYGEVEAVPILLRRLQKIIGDYSFQIAEGMRWHSSELADAEKLAKKVAVARRQKDCGGIFIIFDSDDRCPKSLAPKLTESARKTAGIPCELVMAHREFESWFLAAFDSIRGTLPFVPNAFTPNDPEIKRDAKGTLTDLLPAGRSYRPTVDQSALAQSFDLATAYRTSRSFRHCADAFSRLAAAIATSSWEWPPRKWR